MNVIPSRIGILISGTGSNMCSIIDTCRAEGWPAEFPVVVADRPEAAGLERAAQRGVPTVTIHYRDFHSRRPEFDREIVETLHEARVDWVVLAGFMRLLSGEFLAAFPGRILNIHPSLLPKYPGLNTHARVLEAGDANHGCTVHLVSEGLDTGPILGQVQVPVLDGDTVESLRARVLEQEHILYPSMVRKAVVGQVRPMLQPVDENGKVHSG